MIESDWGLPTIIHAHFVRPAGVASVRLSAMTGAPLIVTEHFSSLDRALPTDAHTAIARSTYEAASHVIAVSPPLRDGIVAIAPRALVSVVPNVVDTDYFFPGAGTAENRPFRFFSLGFLRYRKGMDVLIRAAAILNERLSNSFELVVGGDGPERRRLESLANELGLVRVVRFAGQLDRSEVRTWMQWCDTFVLPSREESFGVVFAEAMATGKWVIATATAGAAFVVDPRAGTLVAIDDPGQLALAMLDAVEGRVPIRPGLSRALAIERFGEAAFRSNMSLVYSLALAGMKSDLR